MSVHGFSVRIHIHLNGPFGCRTNPSAAESAENVLIHMDAAARHPPCLPPSGSSWSRRRRVRLEIRRVSGNQMQTVHLFGEGTLGDRNED